MLFLTLYEHEMNYLTFNQHFAHQAIVSTQAIRKVFPAFDNRRLVEWQRKGYLQRLTNGWYRFTDVPVSESLLWWTANRIYQPSYVSLETALSYHGLIPEGVFSVTSVSTRKTRTITTPVGTFCYRTVKPALYFGYTILRWQDRPVLMADREKALLDLCYFGSHLQHADDLVGLRLNTTLLSEQLNYGQMADYQQLFNSNKLNRRVKTLLTYIENHA